MGRVIGLNEELDISQEFRDLYAKLVAFNPKERPRIKYILKDPWLDEINKLTKEEYKKLEDEFFKFMKKTEKK